MKKVKLDSGDGVSLWVRLLRFVIGVALLPAVWALMRALWTAALSVKGGSHFLGLGTDVFAFVGGIVLFALMYILLPRPTRAYVLAHELTHAIFGFLSGARVGRIRVKQEEGSVMLSKTGFITLLAPYFFPLYTVLLIVFLIVLGFFVKLEPYRFWIYLVIGFSWGFHLCFTLSTLLQHQTDIAKSGYLFSYVLIIYLNLVILTLGLLIATPASFLGFLREWWSANIHAYLAIWQMFFSKK